MKRGNMRRLRYRGLKALEKLQLYVVIFLKTTRSHTHVFLLFISGEGIIV